MAQITLASSRTSPLTRAVQVLSALLAVIVLTVVVAIAGVIAFQTYHRDRIYPGTHVLNVDLGGKTRAEAIRALEDAFTYPQGAVFTFRDGERQWTATPAQLGVRLDAAGTADLAAQVGRLGDPIRQLNDQAYTLWYRIDLAPVVVFDQSRAAAFLQGIAAEVNRAPQDAALAVSGTQVVQTPGRAGRLLGIDATLAELTRPVAGLEVGDIQLIVTPVDPAMPDAAVAAAAQSARNVLAAPVVLYAAQLLPGDPESTWTLTVDRLAQMMTVTPVDGPQGLQYVAALDAGQLRAFLEPVAPLFKRETKDARFIFNENTSQLEVIEPSSAGRELDLDATVAAIQAAAVTSDHRVPFTFKVTQPKYHDDVTAAELGITELLTSQTTYFSNASVARSTNIKVAASRFVGIIVAPGEEFSFNKYLGDVSLDTGFAEALIIYDGRTIQGVGGGVCQVSTTMYRAAFMAGFPTVERWPHAYRVGSYERGLGPGLDATVFAPQVDFKFLNDSATHILIEAYPYIEGGTLTFKIYGTKDREVTYAGPVVSNVVPHPPDKYEENPELAPGEIKQVDYAVDGADTLITRTVTRGGQVLFTDAVFTRYQAWQAVYQYGPGTAVPTPEPTPAP